MYKLTPFQSIDQTQSKAKANALEQITIELAEYQEALTKSVRSSDWATEDIPVYIDTPEPVAILDYWHTELEDILASKPYSMHCNYAVYANSTNLPMIDMTKILNFNSILHATYANGEPKEKCVLSTASRVWGEGYIDIFVQKEARFHFYSLNGSIHIAKEYNAVISSEEMAIINLIDWKDELDHQYTMRNDLPC